ncbi:Small GTPase superfamily and Zinc finger,RING-type domain and Small GTPase superfamily, Rab type and Moulting cycle MLT-10-like protein family and Zinc finger, RING/FYVE/PHD-type domain and Zinc finger, C3HC4 RING-type domain and Small GTPase superfamily, Ras type and P-loop containing nucleoside triphosphate hydrolase domain-containing protein [Strongyloides ratti]|uniref:RING-type domain-containing protein n=1 Tax=Strongyloides ratti TaxID=34506 RepID=A0A090KW95_STRRB|nr:Small GTPase superfamily and Zinc finger,RING-type domain and Small GTPase superfamily, Rab type and Moulting cycle MLT-10-like protein family and Zinc finger, RING/FYVE/PHD-type domain and Zinc finger, C3HC4 RING-type domain and Small GTPase superfamily, Ras type and P-loop containing nucleoside triphosphate hydrolase domain-containing protein [Strongyloides ratti]CEF59542.1 Small GTPase superfamily and Zinc finger,RING-type domain and Small GTPase superfamily, Rab type and Moulting cycle MLT-
MSYSVRSSKTSMNLYSTINHSTNNYNINGSICKVCSKTYKEPVTLPCGHSLCDGCCKQLLYTLKNSIITMPIESQHRPKIRMGLGTYSKVNTLKSVGITINENNIDDKIQNNMVTRITKNDFTSPPCPTCGVKPSLIPPYKNLALTTLINEIEILKNINKQFKNIMKNKSLEYGDENIYKSISPTPSSSSSGYGHSEDDYYKYCRITKNSSKDKFNLPESYRIKECKILIVGGEKVGKSTLIKTQLLNDAFFGNEDDVDYTLSSYIKTKELNYKNKKDKKENDVLKNMYMLQLDECNNFDMDLNKIDGIALVYSVTDRFSLVEVTHFYYMLQETNYDNIPLCLIGLKSDVIGSRRKISYNEGFRRSKELKCQFYEISGRYNKGVNEAFEAEENKAYYKFNTKTTNSLYHKAAISILIKSRANQLLKELPINNKLDYKICIKNAKKLNILAKCIIPLYDIRRKLIKEGIFDLKYYMEKPLIRKKDEKKISSLKMKYNTSSINLTLSNIETLFDSKNVNVLITKKDQVPKSYKKSISKKKFHVIKRKRKFIHKKSTEKKEENKNYQNVNLNFFRKHRIRRKRGIDNSNLFDAEINIKKIIEQRKLEEENQKINKLPLNLKNLKRLERYQWMSQQIKKYVDNVNKHNEDTLSQFNNPLIYRSTDYYSPTNENNIFTILEKLTSTLEDVILKNYKISFFSPNLFNIFPSCSQSNCNKKRKLFSPTLFSFHNDDGFLSLPKLLKNILYNSEEENNWLNFIFDITGAKKVLDNAMNFLGPIIDEMETKIYPAFHEFEKIENQYNKILEMYDDKQLEEIEKNGYTFLYEDQLKMMYNNSKNDKLNFSIDELKNITRLELEERIENDIRQLAMIKKDEEKKDEYIDKYNEIIRINKHKRPWFRKKRGIIKNKKRNLKKKAKKNVEEQNEDPAAEDAEDHEIFNTLQPFAFFNRIGEPVILEIQTLSPHAFINEFLSPEIIVATTLSPRAFIATILTPNILVARILQPGAFRLEIISPRILTAWVLSPEIFLVEVLSPHIIDPKVLSPEYLKIVVLSPTLVSPRVLSQEGLAVLVLSPNILSPNIYSRESLVVEVLSPHLLGGQEITESGESSEGEIGGEHNSKHKEGHEHHSEFHPVHIHTYPFTHLQIPHTIHVGD